MKATPRLLVAVALSAGLLVGSTSEASAQIGVDYALSGSAGNWILDFTLSNTTVGFNQQAYFMGVLLPTGSVTGLPTGYYAYGGFTGYNLTWLTNSCCSRTAILNDPNAVGAGESLSGFEATVTSADAPTSVEWFAYTVTDDLQNPRFEGTATAVASVPEPGTILLLMSGLLGLAMTARRRGVHIV